MEKSMATDAIVTHLPVRQPKFRPVNKTLERIFYSGMAVLLCVCVFIGFSPTYYQAGLLRAPLPSPILHVHGPVFTLWICCLSCRLPLSRLDAWRGIVPWGRSRFVCPR